MDAFTAVRQTHSRTDSTLTGRRRAGVVLRQPTWFCPVGLRAKALQLPLRPRPYRYGFWNPYISSRVDPRHLDATCLLESTKLLVVSLFISMLSVVVQLAN